MDSPRSTRRTLLKHAGLGLAAAAGLSLSGCTEMLPPLGTRVQYGRVDTPAVNPDPVYRRWLPAASALPTDDLDPGYVNHVTPGDLGRSVAGVDNNDPRFFQKPYLDHFGIGYDNYDAVLGMHRTTRSTYVLEGNIDTDIVAETLVQSGYASAGTHGGYDLFAREDSPRTAAVSPDAIVWAHHEESTAIVEAVIDAERGAVPRHHEANDAFARATDAVGAGPWTMLGGLGIDPTGKALVRAMTYSFDADGIYYTHHQLYPETTSVSEQALRDALDDMTRARASRAVDIQVDGQLATIEMHLPHESLRTDYADATVPQITWGVTEGEDSLTIRHEAGDPAPAGAITLLAQRGRDRTELDGQFSDTYDRIQPGDTLKVDPLDGSVDRIVGRFSPVDAARSADFVVYERP